VKPADTKDALDLSAQIALHPNVVGAIVIVLDDDGEIDVGFCSTEDEVGKPIADLVELIRKHCDENHRFIGGGEKAPLDN